MSDDKVRLECELLSAQRDKAQAETAVLRRTTPAVEAIKVLGSMVLGIGGAVAGIAGFQFAQVTAEKYKQEAAVAKKDLDSAKNELTSVLKSKDIAQRERADLVAQADIARRELATISDRLASARARSSGLTESLRDLQQLASEANINLRASAVVATRASKSGADLNSEIEQLFASQAEKRGAAYEVLMTQFSQDPQLVPDLLRYAQQHLSNGNGVYNTLVVLSHIDKAALKTNEEAVRQFAEQARSVGPRTSERADKMLARLVK